VCTSTITSGGHSQLLLLSVCWAQWLDHPGSGAYFYNRFWHLFYTTTTFRVVEHDDLTILGVAHTSMICLWYSFSSITTTLCVVKHDDSTVLEVACTSTITSGGCSLLLLLILCGAYFYDSPLVVILFCHYYFSCVKHDDSTVLGGARTSTITSCGHSLLLLLPVCWAQWLHLPDSDVYFYNHLWWLFSTTTFHGSSTMTPSSWEWCALLRSPLVVVLHYYYTLLLSVCWARCLDFYNHFLLLFSTTSTFCMLGVMIPPSSEWCVLLWSPLVIILHYYTTFCVSSMILLLSMCWV